MGLFNYFIRKVQGVRRMGSAAMDLSYLAAGRLDGFFEAKLRPWDIAAGQLLVHEAGGRCTHFDGSPLKLDAGEMLAGSPTVHEAMVAGSRSVLVSLGRLSKV
jgi:myo-inositol-1(or 4)-monophosphatase